MTLSEIKNQLLSHLLTSPVFTMEDNSVHITVSTELEEFKDQLITAGMADLESHGVVRPLISGTKRAWILARTLASFTQQVTIGVAVAEELAALVNNFRKANPQLKMDVCDKTSLIEGDVANLIHMCYSLMDTLESRP